LLVFLIAVKVSFSEEDLVFSGTVSSKETKEIEGKEFYFIVTENLASVSIDVSGIIIKNGDCKTKDDFRVCITNISFAYRNSTTWEYIYKALVKVYLVKSELEVTKSAAKTEILVGEETDAELKIENSGEAFAENVVLNEEYPVEFLVSNAEGCFAVFNKITFKGQVAPKQTRICKYKLKGLSPVIYDSKAEGSYFNGVETKNLTAAKTITVSNYSLKASMIMDKKNITIGQDSNFLLTLENIDKNNDLKMTSLVLTVPNRFSIKKKPREMQENNNMLIWNGAIGKKSMLNFTGVLSAVKSGRQDFKIGAAYRIGEFLRDFNESYAFDVNCDCPYVDYEVGSLVPGLKTDFIVSLKNPGKLDFKNLKINYLTNIPEVDNFSSAFGAIVKESSIDLVRERIISPAENDAYYFNISVVYESQFNEFFVQKEAISISLEKIEKKKVADEIIKEIAAEEKISGAQEPEKNITQPEEIKGKANETEKEPIILSQKDGKLPWQAISVIAVIAVFILAFVLARFLKGKKEEDAEVPPEAK